MTTNLVDIAEDLTYDYDTDVTNPWLASPEPELDDEFAARLQQLIVRPVSVSSASPANSTFLQTSISALENISSVSKSSSRTASKPKPTRLLSTTTVEKQQPSVALKPAAIPRARSVAEESASTLCKQRASSKSSAFPPATMHPTHRILDMSYEKDASGGSAASDTMKNSLIVRSFCS